MCTVSYEYNELNVRKKITNARGQITSCKIDGKRIEIASDTTKTKSIRRTLPLIPQFKEMLLRKWGLQEEYRRVCGRCYNSGYLDYICVDEMGNIIKPDYLTEAFPKLLAQHGL